MVQEILGTEQSTNRVRRNSYLPTTARYRSHAKINFYLDVLDKRDDGFNNLETLFQTVELYDELQIERTDGAVTLTCSNASLDTGSSNLVCQAADLLRTTAARAGGAKMHLEKNIPVAAGMAGGSGNAAAALVGLNDIWRLGLDRTALHALALELGSDVPYCLEGGCAAATGRGEVITPLPALPETWVVLVHPPIQVSTARVFYHDLLERSPEAPLVGKTPAFLAAIERLKAGRVPEVVFNRLEVPVFRDHPALAAVKEELLALGCPAAAMSGSGATVFGLCRGKDAAEAVAAGMGGHKTTVTRTTEIGVERIL